MWALMTVGVLAGCPVESNEPGKNTEELPVLSAGAATATIAKDADVLNVSITIPNGATASQITLWDGVNFMFASKTLNFDIP